MTFGDDEDDNNFDGNLTSSSSGRVSGSSGSGVEMSINGNNEGSGNMAVAPVKLQSFVISTTSASTSVGASSPVTSSAVDQTTAGGGQQIGEED